MAGTLAEELEGATDRRKSHYWAYDVTAQPHVGFSTNDLGYKWGHVGGDREEPKRTGSGRVRREPVEDSDPLNRRTRNVIESDAQPIPGEYPADSPWREPTATSPNKSRLTTPVPETEDLSHLSGKLVDDEWCSSGELAHNDSRLSGELAPRDSSGELVPEESSAYLSGTLVADAMVEKQIGVVLEGTSFVFHPNLCQRLLDEPNDEDQPGPLPNWAGPSVEQKRGDDLSDNEDQLEYSPIRASEPPRLPEIDTSDDEDLVDELLSKLRDMSDMEYDQIVSMAVIVELGDEKIKKGAASPTFIKTEGATTSVRKGKDVDPLDAGPRSSKLKSKSDKPEKKKTSEPTSAFRQRPEHFRRHDSEKPEGGWFRATTRKAGRSSPDSSDSDSESGDASSPPDSDSSDDESSVPAESSEASTKERKHEHRMKSKMAKNIKMKDPFMYDGTPDLDTLDQWTFEVDTYCDWYDIDSKTSVQFMVKWTTGKASQFLMKHVVRNLKGWDRQLVYEGLFDYCFPTHFKLELRETMMDAVQGSQTVRDYARDLESMAVRFPDVTDREMTQIFWKGLHQHLRLNLIEKGMNPERTGFEKLVKYAQRREDAIETRKREERMWKDRSTGRCWGRFTNSVDEARPAQQGGADLSEDELLDSDEPGENEPTSSTGMESQNRNPRWAPRPRMSEEEWDRLRAEQRCFSCKEVGHESRNCPKRRRAKAPTIIAGAINFDRIQANDDRAREVDLQVKWFTSLPSRWRAGPRFPTDGVRTRGGWRWA